MNALHDVKWSPIVLWWINEVHYANEGPLNALLVFAALLCLLDTVLELKWKGYEVV